MIIKPLMQKKMSTPKAPQFRKRICSNTMNRAVIPRKAWMLSKCRLWKSVFFMLMSVPMSVFMPMLMPVFSWFVIIPLSTNYNNQRKNCNVFWREICCGNWIVRIFRKNKCFTLEERYNKIKIIKENKNGI